LTDGQSAEGFMSEVEKKVNEMTGQYTMNEYKAYKNLVKHKRRIDRVFSEIFKEKSFPSRRPGPAVKMPCVVVASCSAMPLKAPKKKSSKKNQGTPDETTSGVQRAKTKSLELTKRKRRTSEQISDVELQAASGLAQMSHKKAKKAVRKKVATVEVHHVPAAFDDDFPVELAQKGFSSWPFLQFYIPDRRTPSSENEFVDIGSFSDVAEEVQKEVVSAGAIETPAAAMDTAVPQFVHPQEEVSPEFTRDLELTIHKGEEPVQDVALIETRDDLPEGQDFSPSVDAFNKSFSMSHCGELLSVGC
jgi:hypothetical protein